MFAFVHIEKTAGTSFIHILRHNYFLRYLDVRPFSDSSNGLFTTADLKTSLKINPFLSAMAGHSLVAYTNLEEQTPDIQYVTLLRDPVKRYISQYRHWVEKKKINISIEEFLEKREFWNFQTKKISGEADLSVAKNILKNKFLLVGTVESFDGFLILLKNKLQDMNFDPRYRQQNLAKKKVAPESFTPEILAKIKEINAIDVELYNYVTGQLYPGYISEYSEKFSTDLAHFKVLNTRTSPAMFRRYIDYAFRKIYCEPVTNLVRKLNGKSAKGSY